MWQFRVEAWGDPIARWQHDAAIKVPMGQDVELMLADGAAAFERAASRIKVPRATPAGRASQGARQAGRAAGAQFRLARAGQPGQRSRRWPPGCGTSGSRRSIGSPRRPATKSPRSWPPSRCASCSPRPAGSRSSCTGNARSTAPGTSTSPGPRAPRWTGRPGTVASGTLRTAARRLDAVASDGLRRRLSPASPPDRLYRAEGTQQRIERGPGRPGLSMGDRIGRGRP